MTIITPEDMMDIGSTKKKFAMEYGLHCLVARYSRAMETIAFQIFAVGMTTFGDKDSPPRNPNSKVGPLPVKRGIVACARWIVCNGYRFCIGWPISRLK